jgi:hypothetical protein
MRIRPFVLATTIFVLLLAATTYAEVKFFPAVSDGVPDTYMVILVRDASGTETLSGLPVAKIADELTSKYGGTATKIWENAVLGFVAEMSPTIAEGISKDSEG